MAGGAHGWVAGRAGLWGVLPTRVWVGGNSPHVPEHPTSICDAGVNSACADIFFEREAIPSFFIGNCLFIYNQCQRTIKRISEERVDL